MCAEVHLRDGTRITNVGEMREAGIQPTEDPRYMDADVLPTDCLCAVDIPATFKRVGWTYSAPENVYRIPFDRAPTPGRQGEG